MRKSSGVLTRLIAITLMMASGAPIGVLADQKCADGTDLYLAVTNEWIGCLSWQFGDGEKLLCKGNTAVIAPAANPAPSKACWICTRPELVAIFKDPTQWNKIKGGNGFDCLGLCAECTCAKGAYDRTRGLCVQQLCDVPGLTDGNLQAGYFVDGGKLYRESGDPSCSPETWPNVWTPWFNRDKPGGKGDYELLAPLVQEGSVCGQQIDIQCRRKSDGKPWQATGEAYTCDLKTGGVCVNGPQTASSGDSVTNQTQTQRQTRTTGQVCSDYEVRYCCDIGVP